MKNLRWLAAFLCIGIPSFAQDMPGYRAGNYSGVNGVFFNPASIADSRYRWDLNLFSLSTLAVNNNASFSFKELREFEDDKIKTQLFGKNADAASGVLSAQFIGPSLMFNAGKKMTFAITTRTRVMMNAKDLDGKLASKIIDKISNDLDLPSAILSPSTMTASANGWTEFGVSAARVLCDKGVHFFKGGASLKYLAGTASGHMYVNGLQATLNEDAVKKNYIITDASGVVGVGMSGASISKDFDMNDLMKFNSSGLGADLGLVYEYRPGGESTPYKLKLGIAILDIGAISYKKDNSRQGAYGIDISGSEKFDLSSLDGVDLDEFNGFFAGLPQYFTPIPDDGKDKIRVSLPTTLQLDADYHLARKFFINLAGHVSITKTKNKPYNSSYYNALTLTPRYEGRRFGVYVPVNYNGLNHLNAGISVRMGFFFIGSGSALTALVSNSKQADFHLGLRVNGLRRK